MKKNKAVIVFLVRFFVTYFLLTGLYQVYLNKTQVKENVFQCAPITQLVAKQTVSTGNFLGYDFDYEQHPNELSMKLFTNGNYTARVVEGCNSLSIIILFWAFIIAFSGSWQKTAFFGIVGSVSIYFLNILRIVFISLAMGKYPQHAPFLHQIIFPAIIYGFTFLLWVGWVKYFAYQSKKIDV